MSPDALDLRRHLAAGERLLWSGQPRQGLVFRPIDGLLIPFSALWFGFALVWEGAAIYGTFSSGQPAVAFFPLFGVPFIVVGAYMFAGRFLADRYHRSKLVYGVTDQRVLIGSNAWRASITSHDIARLPSLRLSQSGDDRGTIDFSEAPGWLSMNGLGAWHAALGHSSKLFQIDGAKRVYDLIRQAASARP